VKTRNLIWSVFIVISLTGATVTTAQSNYLVKHYTSQDYHAGSQNWSIEADHQGFVFVSNNDGLLVFDGTGWRTYRNPDQTIVRSVHVAPDRRIYTGSYEAFGFWQENTMGELAYTSLVPLKTDSSFHNCEIWKIVQSGDKIYFQGFSSLFVYDKHEVRQLKLPGTVFFLLKAGERIFLQAMSGILYEVISDRVVKVGMSEILAGTEVKTILPYRNGSFLIGTTSNGVFVFDGTSITPWKSEANEQLRECMINNGLVMGNRIIFGTIVKGLFILDQDGHLLNHLSLENALQDNTVLSMASDHNGGIWVGLDRGIDHILFDNLVDIYQEKGDQPGAVYTAALYKQTLYVGTNRGIFTYRCDSLTGNFSYTGFVNNSQGQVWELQVIDGTLICGHTSGTFIVEGREMKKISSANGGFCTRQVITKDGAFLLQSTYSPLVVFKKNQSSWAFSKQVTGYLEPSRYLEADHFGNIWVGHTIKGLYKLQLSKSFDQVTSMVSFGKREGFPSDFNIGVFSLANRVVFTTGSKLFTWDDLGNRMIPYDILNQQLKGFEASTRIVEKGGDYYWFIKHNEAGLFEISGQKAKLLFHLYLPLYDLHMVDGYENIEPLDENRQLICLDNGFAIIRLDMLKRGFKDQSKLIFRNIYCIRQDGERHRVVPGATVSAIPHAFNTLSFSFVSINNRHLTQCYQYKLSGIDRDWSGWSSQTEVTYTRLPRGEYTFMVRSLLSDGTVTEPIVMHFRVWPAWYAGTVAWIVYVLMAIGVLIASRYFFRRRVIRHHENLRLENEAKTLLEKQKAEQEIIKLQNENLQAEISYKNIQLADSTMAIIKKNELLIEIKEELDRQREKLGQGYPQRYFEKLMNLINRNISNDNDWKVFEELFDQAHENFFKRLKSAYPDLTQSDLKLCAYLKLNLSSKEIAPLLNISFRGVETRRYRLRGRLNLESDKNLVDFIMQF